MTDENERICSIDDSNNDILIEKYQIYDQTLDNIKTVSHYHYYYYVVIRQSIYYLFTIYRQCWTILIPFHFYSR